MLDFLQLILTPPNSSLLYEGQFDPLLVALSVTIAVFASYTALIVSHQIGASTIRSARHLWTGLGGLCLGTGIWAMHFVGMLAFTLPCTTAYDPTITMASIAPGIIACTIALSRISGPPLSPRRLMGTGLLLGTGIGAMHFSGMAAMRLEGMIRYDLVLFIISLIVAVSLATLSIWAKFRVQRLSHHVGGWALSACALLMGLAVSGMHYTAMASAYFIRDAGSPLVDAQVSSNFLAGVVLFVSSSIIVVTMVAIFLDRSPFLPYGKFTKVILVSILLWSGLAWQASGYYTSLQEMNAYKHATQSGGRQVLDIADKVEREIKIQKNLALLMSKEDQFGRVLQQFGPDVLRSTSETERQKQAWTQDSSLSGIDRFLEIAAGAMDFDAIYLLNAAGDCIASSNAGFVGSFIGSNFADREYFKSAQASQPRLQYVIGRVTKIPGLYYAHPIIGGGRFVGAVAVKFDIATLQTLLDKSHAFITDSNGAVVLSADHSLAHLAMTGGKVLQMPESQIYQQYGWRKFQEIELSSWTPDRFPNLVRIGGQALPALLTSKSVGGDTLTIHTLRTMPEFANISTERFGLFFLLSIAGSMLIGTTTSIVKYLRMIQDAKESLSRQAEELAASNTELVQSNAELERFTDVLAHHLQEPVRLQHIFAQKLEKCLPDPQPDDVRQNLDFILTNATRLRALIRGVHNYLSLDLPARQAQQTCDAMDAFLIAKRVVQQRLDEVDADVQTGPLPKVPINNQRMVEVFVELLQNAIEYRKPNQPLRLRIYCETKGDEIVLNVRDNGIGIPTEYRHRIFMIFERLHVGGHAGATGIGLAIVKKIVERANGRVWAEDGDEGGTCICVSFGISAAREDMNEVALAQGMDI